MRAPDHIGVTVHSRLSLTKGGLNNEGIIQGAPGISPASTNRESKREVGGLFRTKSQT
jgi:hypothetical protein